MRYNHKKITTPESTIEELLIETEEKKNYKFALAIIVSISLIFSVVFYFRLNISAKVEFDFLFTNRLQMSQK